MPTPSSRRGKRRPRALAKRVTPEVLPPDSPSPPARRSRRKHPRKKLSYKLEGEVHETQPGVELHQFSGTINGRPATEVSLSIGGDGLLNWLGSLGNEDEEEEEDLPR